ncbi:hypothetical protein EUGRSUZ_B02738 [Eucalyptus grandis]|uniref:Uncharacterized protein n=2 Tax=Eucalyptus grandis TaxID=71139 RepID=A0ACC3M1H5_EUCGR|nr:hypothetical protein EUGRSUZ_B02738 [Eucalyptus grandis]
MADHSHDEDPDVEGHEGEHHHIGQGHLQPIYRCLHSGTRDRVRAGPNVGRDGQNLHCQGQDEDEEESQHVHAEPLLWPTGEEDDGVLAPIETHVHHHLHVHSVVAVGG